MIKQDIDTITNGSRCELTKDKLCMRFDMNTIQHLGVKLYSKLPPVLGELVANAWDADATEVTIQMNDSEGNKNILISDTGNGMSLQEINEKFLMIGRNKRHSCTSTTRGRKVIGKKGIGKLSIFGIAEEIVITSVKTNKKNKFRLYLPDILKTQNNEYYPEHLIMDEKSDEKNGTILELKEFKRKSDFVVEEIISDLARRFLVYDKNFVVKVMHNNDENIATITNEMRFNKIEKEFVWQFPNEQIKVEYDHKNDVGGEIFTASKPVPPSMKGVYLVSRGKLVHVNDFYGINANDYAHAYLTGYLSVDFIDDEEEDLISTNRESLNWENEKCEKLQNYLREIINYVAREWREKRRVKKEERIRDNGLDVPKWLDALPMQDRKLAKKITDVILNNPDIDEEKSTELVSYVRDSFEYGSFKEFATKLEATDDITSSEILKLFKDWQVIESKEMYKLALVRIEAIKQFEKKIKENAREIPEMHEFLRNFPWLLDPRIHNFKDEVKYSQLLRDNFPESEVLEEDKRIDFLCIDLANNIFVIELKRPRVKANDKALDQALEYASFLREKKGNDPNFSQRNIQTYLICDGIVNVPKVKDKAEAYSNDGKVYVRTYLDLLQAAHDYHREFIEKYEQMTNNKN